MKKEVSKIQLSWKLLKEFHDVTRLLGMADSELHEYKFNILLEDALKIMQKWPNKELEKFNHILGPDLRILQKYLLRNWKRLRLPNSRILNGLADTIKRMGGMKDKNPRGFTKQKGGK